MINYLQSLGFQVTLSPGLVILTPKASPGITYDYPTIRAAYEAHRRKG